MMNNIQFFSKSKNLDNRYLSNFQVINEGFVINDTFIIKKLHGRKFHSIENAFQASKLCCTNLSNDNLDKIQYMTPIEAKKYGSKKNFKILKETLNVQMWNKISKDIMMQLLILRYNNDTKFKNIIISAKKNNVIFKHFERSGKKSYWGGFFKEGIWEGENTLGKLMQKL